MIVAVSINNIIIIVLSCIPQAGEPRTERMSVSQDWTVVYPTAASFKPSAVPLPVRMGYPVKRGVPPEKKGNLELMKVVINLCWVMSQQHVLTTCFLFLQIPNFLHLTPVAIKQHCQALKRKFKLWNSNECMQWWEMCNGCVRFVCSEFCTEWPSALDSDERCMKHFPIQIQSKEFVSAGQSLRNPDARIVTLKVSLCLLCR